MTQPADASTPDWPGLHLARREAAARGSSSSDPTSPRVVRVLEEAATHAGASRVLRDRDVLRGVPTSDDPAIGRLVVTDVGSAETILDALDRLETADGERPGP